MAPDFPAGVMHPAPGTRSPFNLSINGMSTPPPSDPEDFQQELETLRAILQQNLERTEQDRLLGAQIEFWMQSAQFLETEMDTWERVGNVSKRQQAVERMQKVLDILQQLINRMNDEAGDGKL